MARLWVGNVEEVYAPRENADDEWILPILEDAASRMLFHLEPGDALLVSHPLAAEFRGFVRKVRGYGQTAIPLLVPARRPSPFFLAEAAMADSQVYSQMRRLTSTGTWRVEPIIESLLTHLLGKALGIPGGASDPALVEKGLIDRINDKQAFKKMAGEAGVPVIPGGSGETLDAIRKLTFRIPAGPDGSLTLRRSRSAGGRDILTGDPETLRERFPDWFRPGVILVETTMPFTGAAMVAVDLRPCGPRILGSLGRFGGSAAWTVWRCPLPDAGLARRLERDTLRVATRLHGMGARGPLTIFWGLIERDGFTEAMAIKADLRHDRVSQIINLYKAWFPPGGGSGVVHLYENPRPKDASDSRIRTGEAADAVPHFPSRGTGRARPDGFPGGLDELLTLLGNERFEGEPLLFSRRMGRSGILPLQPPDRGRRALAVVGPDHPWAEAAWASWITALAARHR